MESKESTSMDSKDKSLPQSLREVGGTAVHLNLHAQHNSLVEFTFMNKLSSSNELTLVRLNALFEKIADRNAMAIRADKLFRLILKAGRNKVTTERYRRILDIEENDSNKIRGRKGIFRVISRGPFLAMFKHESISFVNSLETAARSLNNKKIKKKKSSGDVKCSSSTRSKEKEEAMSTRQTIATAPASSSSPSLEKSSNEKRKVEKPNSLGRKTSRDKTGMIILADKDCCDEMSAVSVSPVNGVDGTKAEDGKNVKFHAMESIKESPTKEMISIGRDSVKNTLSSTKKRSSRRKRKEMKQRSSKKAAREKKSRTSFEENSNHHQSHIENEPGHSRCNSSVESITNIREVMQANASPRESKRLKTENRTPMQPRSKEVWMNNRDDFDFGQPPLYGKTSFALHPYNVHPPMYPVHYGHVYPAPHLPYDPHMHSQVYHNQNVYRTEEDMLCANQKEDCFIFGKLASLIKRVIGKKEREEVLDDTNHIFDTRDGIFRQPFAKEIGYDNYDHSLHRASYMFHPGYDQEDYHLYHGFANWNSVPQQERHDTHMWEKNEGRCGKNPRNNGNLYDSSNKLKVYDFKPSIKLPEPERHRYKPDPNEPSPEPVVYDCRSIHHGKARHNDRQHEDRGARFKSKVQDDEVNTNYEVRRVKHGNNPEPRGNDRRQERHSAKSEIKILDIEPDTNRRESKLKNANNPESSVGNLKTDNYGKMSELCEEKKSPARSNSNSKEINEESKHVLRKSESIISIKAELSTPSFLDPNIQSKGEKEKFDGVSNIKEAKTSNKKTKAQSEQPVLTRHDKKVGKKLLNTRPKAIGKSVSLSDRKSSRGSLGETMSLTRASSIGSAVSSLTESSDLISEQSHSRSSAKYYHYR